MKPLDALRKVATSVDRVCSPIGRIEVNLLSSMRTPAINVCCLPRHEAELLRARLRGEVNQADYAEANREFDDEIESMTRDLQAIRSQHGTLEAFLRFSKLMLVDIAAAWQRANVEERISVQNFLFQGGIKYRENEKFLNTANPTLFQQLRRLADCETVVGVPDGI